VVLMDMQMPELDGYQATQQLRAAGYGRAIVALTAHAMGGDREKCINAGCNDFAVKPIEREKLIAVLSKYLQEAQQPPASQPAPASQKPIETHAPAANDHLSALRSRPATARLVEKFVSKLDDRLAAIRAAAQAQDLAALKTLAHQLKGAAGGYGYPQISHAAEALERSVLDDLDSVARSIKELADLCHSARSSAEPHFAKS
jgi:response regulator RpfG family c-di-GMP phosphodiesterase